MKRIALVFVLTVCVWSRLYSQTSGPADVILLLDTSFGMAAGTAAGTTLYEETNAYLTSSFLRRFLRIGDTFHLIPFSNKPFLDISRRVTSRSDAEIVIGRMLLHYPLDPRADISAALNFAEKYVSSLPDRPKKIVLVSANNISNGETGLLTQMQTRLARQNTTLEFVQIIPGQYAVTPPRPAPVPSTLSPALPPAAVQPREPPTPPPEPEKTIKSAVTPEQIQEQAEGVPESETEQVAETEPSQEQSTTSVEEPPPEQNLVEQKPAERQPETAPKPVQKPVVPAISLKQLFTDTTTVLILSGMLWLLALLIPALYAAAVSKKIFKQSPTEISNLLFITMYVEDQSTYIGRRNTHALKPGYSYTVGGKDSDFLVFIVQIPPHIAKIHLNKKNITFTPLVPRYFPDLGSKELKDCINKTIKIISDKNYQLKIKFNNITVPNPEL